MAHIGLEKKFGFEKERMVGSVPCLRGLAQCREPMGSLPVLLAPCAVKENVSLFGYCYVRKKVFYKMADEAGQSALTETGQDSDWLPPGHQIDRGWAWIVLISSMLLHGLSVGMFAAVGVFVVEWIETFDHSRTAISWIISLLSAFAFSCGPIASALCNRFSHRTVVMLGSLISTFGTFVTCFAPNVPTLYISFGVVTGFGISFMYGPAYMFVGTYFSKYQSLALVLSTVGGGLGPMALAPFNRYLINQYGWRGAMMIVSALLLNGCVFGALMSPAESWIHTRYRQTSNTENISNQGTARCKPDSVRSKRDLRQHDNNKAMEKGLLDGTGDFDEQFQQDILFAQNPCQKNIEDEREFGRNTDINEINHCNKRLLECQVEHGPEVCTWDEEDLRNKVQKQKFLDFFDVSLLSEVNIWLFIIATVLWTVGTTVFYVYVVDFARATGMTDYVAASVVSVHSASSVVPRIFVAFLLIWTSLRSLHIFTFSILLGGLGTFLLPLAVSPTSFISICAICGASLGIMNATLGVVTVQVFGVDRCTAAFSYMMVGSGLGAIIGPPVAGALYDASQNYEMTFYFAGASMFLSGCVIGIIYIRELSDKRKNRLHSTKVYHKN